jgi:L-threonylcarbamoyladenylate synthase
MKIPSSLPNCSVEAIHEAAEKLRAGHLVAFPTETVYGLGADAVNELAVKRIYEVKGRPTNHPLIVHVASIDALEVWAQGIPQYAFELAQAYWPGPMTLVLKRTHLARDFITGGQDSIGIRVPSDPIALALLNRFEFLGGLGVAAPSANRFGQVSPTTRSDVIEEIGDFLLEDDLVLNGRKSQIGIESTIIDSRGSFPVILRPGAITEPMINEIRQVDSQASCKSTRVSGAFEKHYAPAAKILLDQTPIAGQAYFAMSQFVTPRGVYRIASPDSEAEFAKNLYSSMREADRKGFRELVIVSPRDSALSTAIMDRLNRASNGR